MRPPLRSRAGVGTAQQLFGQLERAGRAIDDRVGQAAGLRQHVVGVEARGDDLGLVEAGIALARLSLPLETNAARAICQPPATMPSSSRKGTNPTEAALMSLE